VSLSIDKIVDHIRNRAYMGGIERDNLRVKATGEVFTPTDLVRVVLENMDIEKFKDPNRTFLDPACGDGQFLGEIMIRKIENGSTFEEALCTVYGVDLMQDNVDLCRERLLCGQEHLRYIVEKNIQCKDGLTYGYKFVPMGPARKKKEADVRRSQARLKAKAEKQKVKEAEIEADRKAQEQRQKAISKILKKIGMEAV